MTTEVLLVVINRWQNDLNPTTERFANVQDSFHLLNRSGMTESLHQV